MPGALAIVVGPRANNKMTHLRRPRTDTGSSFLQFPIPNEEGEQARENRSRDDDDEGVVERGNVGVDNLVLELLVERKDDGDGLQDGLEGLLGDHVGVLGKVGAELGAEDHSGDGNTNGTTDELQERNERSGLGDRLWLVCELCLGGDDRVVECDADTGTEENLIPDQLYVARVCVNGEEETAGGRSDERTEEEERPVASRFVDNYA